MSLKVGNFSFQAHTAQNWLRMGKYGIYLEFNRSQEAPKHCQTFDSLTQYCAGVHFRSPPVLSIKDFFKERSIVAGKALAAHWRRTGGDLKWAPAQHWVSESKVWQCSGASSDLLNSTYVPYFSNPSPVGVGWGPWLIYTVLIKILKFMNTTLTTSVGQTPLLRKSQAP